MKSRLFLLLLISIPVLLLLCSDDGDPLEIKSLVLSQYEIYLPINENYKLQVAALNNDGISVASDGVTWRSSDSAVVSVDSTGQITTNALGTVEIRAVYEDVESDPCSVFVVEDASEIHNVLFIGNSLTNFYYQQYRFAEMADSSGKRAFIGDRAVNGVVLEAHNYLEETTKAINALKWDYVVLQGSNYFIALPDSHHLIYPYVEDLKNKIHDNHPETKIVFFMDWATKDSVVWGGETYTYDNFQGMIYNGTMMMADSLNMMVAPIGAAWSKVIKERSDIDLYYSDGAHPSRYGGFLNTCVYFSLIFQENSTDLNYDGGLEPEVARYLRETASSIVLDSLSLWLDD